MMNKIKAHEMGLNRRGAAHEFTIVDKLPGIGDSYDGGKDVTNVEEFKRDVESRDANDYDLYIVTTFEDDRFQDELASNPDDEEELRELYTERHYVAIEHEYE